jgi:hypothetical protein
LFGDAFFHNGFEKELLFASVALKASRILVVPQRLPARLLRAITLGRIDIFAHSLDAQNHFL